MNSDKRSVGLEKWKFFVLLTLDSAASFKEYYKTRRSPKIFLLTLNFSPLLLYNSSSYLLLHMHLCPLACLNSPTRTSAVFRA